MASKKKKFLKHLIRYNPLDYWGPRYRKFLKRLGILKYLDSQFYWIWWDFGTWLFGKVLWKGKYFGITKVNHNGSAIYIANHSNAIDPFFASRYIYSKTRWLSKIENFQIPFYRMFLHTGGAIPVRRGESDKNALKLIRRAIERGESIAIFPEGTRTRTGHLGPFHTGAARMCLEYDIPYVPIGIRGTYKTKLGHSFEIHYGAPVYPKMKGSSYENAKILSDQMKKDIIRLSKVQPEPISLIAPKVKVKSGIVKIIDQELASSIKDTPKVQKQINY